MSAGGNFGEELEQELGVEDVEPGDQTADVEGDAEAEVNRVPENIQPPGGARAGDTPRDPVDRSGQTGPREVEGGRTGPPPDPTTGEVDQTPDAPADGGMDTGDAGPGGPPDEFDVGDVVRQGPGSPGPDRPSTAPGRDPAGGRGDGGDGRPDIDSDQIARDVGAAIQRGDVQPPQDETPMDLTDEESAAVAEAMREAEGQFDPFRPDALEAGTTVRSVGEGAFLVSLQRRGGGRETVAVTPSGPGGEFVAPFQPSEAEMVGDTPAVQRLGGFREAQQREEVREQAAESVEERFGVDVEPGQFDVVEEGERLVAEPGEEVQESIQASPRTGAAIPDRQEDLAAQIERDEAAVRRRAAIRGLEKRLEVAASVDASRALANPLAPQQPVRDLDRGEDIVIEETDDGLAGGFTTEFRDRQVAEQVREQLDQPGFRRGEEFEIQRFDISPETAALVGEGAEAIGAVAPGLGEAIDETVEPGEVTNVQLTPQGRRAQIRTQAARQGEVAVQEPSTEIFGQTIGGDERSIPIEDVSQQLAFDEQGNLVGIREPETSEAELRQLVRDVPVPVVGEALAGSRIILDELGEASQSASEAIGDVVVEPLTQPSSITALPIGTARAQTFEEEEGPEAAEPLLRVTEGGLMVPQMAVGLPETAASATRTAGEAGAFAVEESVGESAEAAAGEVVDVGESVVISTAENPLRTTGTLIGSAAAFGAARAVGPQTSLAARGAIQPGEELLGRAGAGAFRAAPGQATSRIGNVLFPRGEPLLASEEAAIAAGVRARAAAGRASERIADVSRRTTVSMRPGVGLGGVEVEIEPREGEAVELAEERAIAEPPGTEFQESVRPELDPEEDIGAADPLQRRRRRMTEEGGDPRSDIERFMASEIGGRTTVEGERGRLEEAQQPFFAGETEFERELERTMPVETVVDAGVGADRLAEAQQVDTLQEAAELERAEVGVDLRGRTEAEQASELEPRTDARTRLDIEQEQRAQLDQELDQEFESELEQELENEVEQETERELEQEAEIETETEIETELFDDRAPEDDDRRRGGFGFFDRRFEFDVTDPGEVGEVIETGLDDSVGATDDIDGRLLD